MYPQIRPLAVVASIILVVSPTAGCKKRVGALGGDPAERGKLTRIANNLEEAYARANLPPLTEPASFAERLSKWDDFKACTVKTYVARKRDFDAHARQGVQRPSRHASIGDEAVEECAVQSAVVNKDPTLCERLALDYAGPNGETPRSAMRCWDTRARILGLPEECPVVWMPDDVPARNPECLALARRDASLCPFTDSPGRCRALLAGNASLCKSADAALDCSLAVTYWSGLIPTGMGPALFPPPKAGSSEAPLGATFDLELTKNQRTRLRAESPPGRSALSWPAAPSRTRWVEEDTTGFWGAKLSTDTAQVTWRQGSPAVKLAFLPGGSTAGVRPLGVPAPGVAATVIVVWADPSDFRRCQPAPHTTGEVRFDAGTAQPGATLTGTVEAKGLGCTDGSELDLRAKFRLVILDVR